jgi:AraC-type DNA-binding domain-containing proteins
MPFKDMLFNHFLLESITYKYCEGSEKKEVPAHNTGWRSMPFNVIIYSYDNDYICELQNGDTHTIEKGQSIVVPADMRHKMISRTTNTINFVHIQFTILGIIDILSLFTIPYVFDGEKGQIIGQSIEQLNTNYFDDSEAFPIKKMLEQREAAFRLLNTIISVSTVNEDTPKLLSNIYKIYPVLSYIQKNAANITSRKELSDVLKISETRFHYIFKDITGQSPVSYLKNVRLKKSQLLLLTTDMTIDSVAKQVGYEDVFNFSKQFKKRFGTSPSEYRKGHKFNLV